MERADIAAGIPPYPGRPSQFIPRLHKLRECLKQMPGVDPFPGDPI